MSIMLPQLKYTKLLKVTIQEQTTYLSQRLNKFSLTTIQKIKKIPNIHDYKINVDESEYYGDELIDEILDRYSIIKIHSKNTYYNKYLKDFIKQSFRKNENEIIQIYKNIDNGIKEEFTTDKENLYFCLKGLQAFLKEYKNYERNETNNGI